MDSVPVIRIKSSHPSQGEFVEINASDFDPAKHERFDAPAPKAKLTLPPPPPPAVAPPQVVKSK